MELAMPTEAMGAAPSRPTIMLAATFMSTLPNWAITMG
jgi:hypothetical protein